MNAETNWGDMGGMLSRIACGPNELSSLTAKAWAPAGNVILHRADAHAFAVRADAFSFSQAIRESMPPAVLEALS